MSAHIAQVYPHPRSARKHIDYANRYGVPSDIDINYSAELPSFQESQSDYKKG